MPRIPSIDELPLVQPRPLPTISVDTGAGSVARAFDGAGEALFGFGEKLAVQSEKARRADQLAKLNQKTAAAGGELGIFVNTLRDDPDYAGYPDRFKAKVEDIRTTHRDGLDPDMAERFDARFRDHALPLALEVRTLGTRRLVESAKSALDGQLASLAELAAAAGNDAGHRQLVAQAAQALDDHVEAGLIGADDRNRLARRFLADVGARQARAMARRDPDALASRLNDPTAFPELDDEHRTRLTAYARSRSESVARDAEIWESREEAKTRAQRLEAARVFASDWRGRLAAGDATLVELDDAVLDGVLSEGHAESLRDEAGRAAERTRREGDLIDRIQRAIAGGERLDPADDNDRDAVDHVFKSVYRPRLIEAVGDPRKFIGLLPDLARDIERIGLMPEAIDDLVDRWWASGDSRFQAGAARLYGALGRFEETDKPDGPMSLGLAPPIDLRQRLDLAANLIDAGIPDEVAVKRARNVDFASDPIPRSNEAAHQ